jgi:anaerobic ribonucleoside-triphosphate reductase activating protein
MQLNLARTISRSAANGPGQRFVVWVQGCAIRCPGCWNPDTWEFETRQLRDAAELADEVLATDGIEGITLTGGEPFHQARALAEVARRVSTAGLSVFVFSGYELHQLIRPEQRELLAITDVLVAGPYIHAQRSLNIPWRGSTNQVVHFLTPRYDASDMSECPSVEFHIATDGQVFVTGFPLPQFLEGGDLGPLTVSVESRTAGRPS